MHQRTGGNPLFAINLLSDLAGRGVLVERGGSWTVRGDLQACALEVPLLAARAAIGRGRLWRRLGRRDEARQLVRASCESPAESLMDADRVETDAVLRD